MFESPDFDASATIRAAQHARHAASFELMALDNTLERSYTIKTGTHSWGAVFEYADGTVKTFDGKNWSTQS